MNIKRKLKFIYVFLLIGLESFGNMSAVSAVLEENLIKKNKWITEEDLIDSITISRLGPGATTANMVAFIGNKIAGFLGGVVATICYTIMPLLFILAISGIIDKLIEYSFVISALRGCLICICAMFIKSTIDMGKTVLINWFNILIFIAGIIIAGFFNISSIWVVIGSIIIGIIINKKIPNKNCWGKRML